MTPHSCGVKASYSERHDAFFCAACNLWLEKLCGHRCGLCEDRPVFPNTP